MPGTTPVYGFPYPEPTDLVADYPALGQDLAEDIEAVLPTLGGLAPVAPTSIANSGGSASTTGNTTTFSTVSSISLNGVFTSSYTHYRIIWRMTAVSATDTSLGMRLRASGTDSTGANYGTQRISAYSNVTQSENNPNGNTVWNVGFCATANGDYHAASLDVYNPNTANKTLATGSRHDYTSTTLYVTNIALFHNQSTAYDGFTLYPVASGTITGSVSVYGYRK